MFSESVHGTKEQIHLRHPWVHNDIGFEAQSDKEQKAPQSFFHNFLASRSTATTGQSDMSTKRDQRLGADVLNLPMCLP
eukprot:2593489-Amphidinium_carterae.1